MPKIHFSQTHANCEDNRKERIFVADYAKKTLIVPKDEQVIGVKGDNYGRYIRIELLKAPDSVDLSQSVVEVQYQNALGETGRQRCFPYKHTDEDGDEVVDIDFKIPASLTKEAGTVLLQVCGTVSNGYNYNHWHLAPIEVQIAEFFDVEDNALSDPKDDLTIQIQADITSLETQIGEIKETLGSMTGTGDQVSTNITAEIASLKNRATTLESGKLGKSEASDLYLTKTSANDTYVKTANLSKIPSAMYSAITVKSINMNSGQSSNEAVAVDCNSLVLIVDSTDDRILMSITNTEYSTGWASVELYNDVSGGVRVPNVIRLERFDEGSYSNWILQDSHGKSILLPKTSVSDRLFLHLKGGSTATTEVKILGK